MKTMTEKPTLSDGTKRNNPDSKTVLAVRALLRRVSAVYCMILFFCLPLVIHDKYFDIGKFKYDFFFYTTVTMLAVCLVLGLLLFFLRAGGRSFDPTAVIEALKGIDALDRAVLIYALVCIVSYFLSPYNTWAFGYSNIVNPPLTGYPGWSMGLYSQLMFAGIYYVTSRLSRPRFRRYIMGALYFGSLAAYLLAILNRFSVDPFGFYTGVDSKYHLLFLSTLGQATWYSSYLSTIFPIALAMFIYEKRTRYRSFYVLYIIVGSVSLVTQNSDSAYVALFAAILVLFVFALDSNNYFTRFFQLILLILLSFRLAGILQLVFPEQAVLPGSISLFLSQSGFMLALTVILLVLYLIFSLLQMKPRIIMSRIRILRTILLILTGIGVLFGISALVLSTRGIRLPLIGDFEYFIFNDDWGNGRGFTWRITVEMMKSFRLPELLFGVGPDCYSEFAYEFHTREMLLKWGNKVLANAHNEWLNTAFTLGITGFLSYLSIFASAFVQFIRRKNISALSIAGAAAVASYVCHNFFCYQQVLCTPFIFAIIGICKANIRTA
ncbi:MAG: O-antigen ligase family protein, partial [Lachnospiraceae bacterium]|nr:O-antigen ligase family protein [Lachnospiraceae bacterium]